MATEKSRSYLPRFLCRGLIEASSSERARQRRPRTIFRGFFAAASLKHVSDRFQMIPYLREIFRGFFAAASLKPALGESELRRVGLIFCGFFFCPGLIGHRLPQGVGRRGKRINSAICESINPAKQ